MLLGVDAASGVGCTSPEVCQVTEAGTSHRSIQLLHVISPCLQHARLGAGQSIPCSAQSKNLQSGLQVKPAPLERHEHACRDFTSCCSLTVRPTGNGIFNQTLTAFNGRNLFRLGFFHGDAVVSVQHLGLAQQLVQNLCVLDHLRNFLISLGQLALPPTRQTTRCVDGFDTRPSVVIHLG